MLDAVAAQLDPNALAHRIVNYTLTPRARVRIIVGIAYKEDLDAAGIEIPYPHLQLFVEDTDGVRRLAGGRDTEPSA